MNALARLRHHLARGTLLDAVLQRLGIAPVHLRVRWYGAESESQALAALARWGRVFLADAALERGWVLAVGDRAGFHAGLVRALERRGIPHKALTLDEALALRGTQATAGLAGILCGFADARRMTAAARALAGHPELGRVPFEYAAGVTPERQLFLDQDEYADTYFVAPSLNDVPGPHALYRESLKLFEQKCGLRDFLDLYQLLKHVVDNGVPGDVAEFGSYRGHSGWLIARTLEALGSGKRVFLFDAFEEFPAEPYGLDHLWNRTHTVNFAAVRAKFRDLPSVSFVQGDFTQTLAQSAVGGLALAYVDCDSYRATRHLIREILSQRLAAGGVLAVEDYGHPALLGSRAAVHEELDGQPGYFRYFSQFSGIYSIVKLPTLDR